MENFHMSLFKKQMQTLIIALSLCCIFFRPCQALAQYNAIELTDNIKDSERQIHDMQMHVDWYEPETNNKLVIFDWGFENGKEFIEGYKWGGVDGTTPTAKVKYAFDGDKQRNFRHNTGEERTTGGIYGLTPTTFSVYGTPKTLLGYAVAQNTPGTFGEILSKADSLKLKEVESINGFVCSVIEAEGIKDGSDIYDIRAWIDTTRSFRPLKIEKYDRIPEHVNWELLTQRIDNIILEKINGIWFPILGDCQDFDTQYLPPERMSEAEFKKLFGHLPLPEQRKKQRCVNVPKLSKRRIAIDANSIKINKGIEPEMFKVDFPTGCRVWDDFVQIGYEVGTIKDEILLEPLSRENPHSSNKNDKNSEAIADPTRNMMAVDETVSVSKESTDKEIPANNVYNETDTNSVKTSPLIIISVSVLVLVALVYYAHVKFLHRKS